MKHLAVFILILISNISNFVFACGPFYPHGEDIRFSLLNPAYFKYKSYSLFYYSTNSFPESDYTPPLVYDKDSVETSRQLNIDLWRKRCHNIPTEKDIYEAIYLSGQVDNPFIKYLYKNDAEALQYLDFAIKCASFNSFSSPWETNEDTNRPERSKLIQEALNKAGVLKDADLKLRYAFMAVRLAYYNGDYEIIKETYKKFFSNRKDKNIIDYWGMYFRALTEPPGASRNYYASQVFANAPDKRFMINQKYDKAIAIHETLRYAKNNKEKAAIWLLAGIKNKARALESIQNVYALDPQSEGLSFLLLREINKLEDWIYTPYYTYFEPSTSTDSENGQPNTYLKNQDRIKKDRAYAQDLLNFMSSKNLDEVENPLVWKTSKAYLFYMTQKYSSSLAEISFLQKRIKKDDKINGGLEMIKALCLTARQTPNKAIILDKVKPLLMHPDTLTGSKFIFAIARELEYKGNTTDAAILLSKLNASEYVKDGVYWKTRQNHSTLYYDFYYDYFFYLDAQYTPRQIENLISDIKGNKNKDAFSAWKYSMVKKDTPRLYDLTGTKYLRKNDLKNALSNYEKVNDTLWTSSQYSYKYYIDANPFYTNMYNEHARTKADTITYNKESITRTLIEYLSKANDVNNTNRDYYYFLAANCYLNMTHYGNSWMMKRYYWTSYAKKTQMEDDAEYFSCNYAKNYYLKAKEVSKNAKFSALCLRMAGRCEKYAIINNISPKSYDMETEEYNHKVFEANKYYKQIKQQYPDYYSDLISNCESFGNYFSSRR